MIPYANGRIKVVAVQCMARCPVINLPMRIVRERARNLKMQILGVVHNDQFMIPEPDTILAIGDEVYFVAEEADITKSMALFGHEEKEARRILIFGGGNIGKFIAEKLEEESNDIRIKIIEFDRARAEETAAGLNRTTVLCGSALDHSVLMEANVNMVETVIAVTNDDEVNVLASLLSKRFGAQRCITLVNNTSYSPLLGNLGVDVTVNPRETTVSTILQHIRRGKIRGVHTIHDGAAEIIEAEAIETSPLIGKALGLLDLPKGVAVGAILRRNEVLIPDENSVIQQNDRIIIMATTRAVKKVEQIFSVSTDFY